MKAFGYARTDQGAEMPEELREITLRLTRDELDRVIQFLKHVRSAFEGPTLKAGESHFHFRDWWKGWKKSEADLIVVCDSPAQRSPPASD